MMLMNPSKTDYVGMPAKQDCFTRRAKLLFICFAYMSMAAMTLY